MSFTPVRESGIKLRHLRNNWLCLSFPPMALANSCTRAEMLEATVGRRLQAIRLSHGCARLSGSVVAPTDDIFPPLHEFATDLLDAIPLPVYAECQFHLPTTIRKALPRVAIGGQVLVLFLVDGFIWLAVSCCDTIRLCERNTEKRWPRFSATPLRRT